MSKKGISMRRRLAAQDEVVRILDAQGKVERPEGFDLEAWRAQVARVRKLFQMEEN